MKIRQLGPADAAIYQELRLYALQESPAAFGSSYAREVDWPLEVIAERLGDERNHTFGAFSNDGGLFGSALLRREAGEGFAHKADLYAMYVKPEYRRQGAGCALVEAVIARAEEIGVRQINLMVNNAQKPAVQLYTACGFERFGLERDAHWIGDGFADTAYMVRRVKDV